MWSCPGGRGREKQKRRAKYLTLPFNTSTAHRGEKLSLCSCATITSAMMTSCQEFEVTVHTSPGPTCGTFSRLWLNLIGSRGETPPISVNDGDHHLLPGSACRVQVQTRSPLGHLVLVRLRLKAQTGFPNLGWHCSRVEVRELAERPGSGPEGSETQVFPCDKWLQTADGDVELRRGKLSLLKDETEEKLKQQRLKQLQQQQKLIRWRTFVDGSPQCVDLSSLSELGPNLSYTHKSPAPNMHYLKGFAGRAEAWTSFTELEMFFAQSGHQNSIARFVRTHWMEDWYFGYQCLNGCNPLLLRQVHLLPPHLSVTPDMLRPFLPEDSSLKQELQKGTIYLLDYEVLDGIPANVINGKQTYLCAPLCLLHLNQQQQLVPIAIQLLMPHVKTSLQINFQARASLLAADGVFDKVVGCGLQAIPLVLSRASQRIHYRSLCVPDDLSDRGVDKLPQSHYAQDALRVWDALHRFVVGWVDLYYSADSEVQQDSELQHWITDINGHGFTNDSGFPQVFQTKAEVSRFVTMIIYTCSALHAAVNFSQLDFTLWMPNCPASMSRPPPEVKGSVTEEDIMSFLPDVNSTCRVLMALTLLSQPTVNFVPLCQYKEAVFRDDAHRRLVVEVQAELKTISDHISERNSQLELPYPYLCPEHIENSVAI
ncbi:hydroperoxide isomerase ALOXE3 isoform X3 [Xiphias gladius]|uniref:hydroperoxide isomerase ALOXE3 isoform X3 n=1 Tax=Xiphias gladius TaxID=8245 RepID=UPI001A998246|nr:hydroperoxide isomerase ALOXE3 isoform X3 [Xiphias gladius]